MEAKNETKYDWFCRPMWWWWGGKIFAAYHPMLNRIFCTGEDGVVVDEYFRNLWRFSIIFRVARGNINFQNGQGPEFLKKVRNKPCYTIDYTIPQAWWEGKSDKEFRPVVANGVRECFELLKKRAIKDNEIIDLEKLDNDFNAGIELFLSQPLYEPKWDGPFEKFPDWFIAQTCGGQ